MLFIVPILLFAILCLCLPQIMLQILIGVFGYITCKILRKYHMAKMIIVISFFACLNVVMAKAMPLIEEQQAKAEYVENQIDKVKKYVDPSSKYYDKADVQKDIDKVIEDSIEEVLPNNKYMKKLQEYPRTK